MLEPAGILRDRRQVADAVEVDDRLHGVRLVGIVAGRERRDTDRRGHQGREVPTG